MQNVKNYREAKLENALTLPTNVPQQMVISGEYLVDQYSGKWKFNVSSNVT